MSYELTNNKDENEKATKCEKCGRTHGDCPGCKEFCERAQKHNDHA
jgi:hypothetical protein